MTELCIITSTKRGPFRSPYLGFSSDKRWGQPDSIDPREYVVVFRECDSERHPEYDDSLPPPGPLLSIAEARATAEAIVMKAETYFGIADIVNLRTLAITRVQEFLGMAI